MSERIIALDGIRHRVRVDGEVGEWVIFSNSLGCSLEMWDAQAAALRETHRVLRYDTRGHGGSEATRGPYSLDLLASDLLGILDALEIDRAHLAGLSLGGMIAQHAALRAAHRFATLLLADTTSHYGAGAAGFWEDRAATARMGRLDRIAATTPSRWFTPAFAEQRPDTVARFQSMLTETDPEGYAGCCSAIASVDTTPRLRELTMPTAVVVGDSDPSTTVEHAGRIQAAIPGSTLHVIPGAAHLSNVEQPERFTAILTDLLTRSSA